MLSARRFACILASIITLSSASAFAWNFSCNPETDHPIGVDAPNVFIMLDQSGSMNTISTDMVNTRWQAATTAVSEVTKDLTTAGACAMPGDATCDDVRFGFGTFSGDVSSGAEEHVGVIEDSNVATSYAIDGAIMGEMPGGSTTVGDAAEVIASTSGLTMGGANFGILISDGGPSTGSCNSITPTQDTVTKAVRELCDAKLRPVSPVQTYSVGFGTNSSADTNSLFAAAGGTGSCCLSSDCGDNPFDPCTATDAEIISHIEIYKPSGFCNTARLRSTLSCTGSIEASSPSDLKAALQDVAAAAVCSFPLEIPAGYPTSGGALDDPDATRVRIEHILTSPGLIDLPHVGDPASPDSDLDDDFESTFGVPSSTADLYEDEGWYFTDSSRRFVALTPRLCADLQADDVQQVKTQVSCACMLTGPCTITGGGWTPSQLANMRCAAGEWQCMSGTDVCVPIGTDQPEICNGLDDDCDGIVDNIKDSWQKPAYSMVSLPADHAGVDCNQLNSCACPLGVKDDHAGTDFDTYLDNWDPVCQCGGGLSAPEDSEPPAVHLDDDAACATGDFGDTAPFGLMMVLFAGALVIRRRRL